MTDEFKKIVNEDIDLCTKTIDSRRKDDWLALQSRLVSKYGSIIDGFADNLLKRPYTDDGGYFLKNNLTTLKQKLELFKAMGYENHYAQKTSGDITFNNSNTNKLSQTINITFEAVRGSIENMSALKEDEIQEILSKIAELEKIVNSQERKTQKWEKSKNIIKWIADKSVDVGIAMLPLVLQIGM